MPKSPQKPPSHSWQPWILLVGLAIWVTGYVLWPVPLVASLLVAYVLALVVVNWLLVGTSIISLHGSLTFHQRRWLFVGLAIPLLAVAFSVFLQSGVDDSLATLRENMQDRLYLEQTPAIAPPLLVNHHPQRFFIHAPHAKQVSIQLLESQEPDECIPLGEGLFLWDFDPLESKTLRQYPRNEIPLMLVVDGESHQRKLPWVREFAHPRWIHAIPGQGVAATVSEETDELIIVRRDGSHRRIPVGDGPSDCCLVDDGKRVVVAHLYDPIVVVVDSQTGSILKRLETERFQNRMALSPDGSLIAIAQQGKRRGVQFYSWPKMDPVGFALLDISPDWLVFGRDATELVISDRQQRVVARLKKVEATAENPSKSQWKLQGEPLLFARPVVTMNRGPMGETVVLATTAPFMGEEPIPADHFVDHSLITVSMADWQVIKVQSTDQRGLGQATPGETTHGISPMGLIHSEGNLLATCAGSNEIAMVAPDSLQFLPLDDQLAAPHGIADLGEGHLCVSSPANGTIGVFDANGERTSLITLAPSDEELSKSNFAALTRRRGERSFYAGTRAGLGCQSCHLHADTDSCLHAIAQPRFVLTLSVRGVAGTSPYLRDGGHWQLRELHQVAADVYRGYPRDVPFDRSLALEAYMKGLPPRVNWRGLEPLDESRMRAGVAAFVKADCVHCHAFPLMTNLGQHPESLLFPKAAAEHRIQLGSEVFVDTPSLRAISQSAPYLNDGRAKTLEEVLKRENPEGRHGNVGGLSEREYQDLLYFLWQL